MSAKKRGGVRPTHEWEPLAPLFEWPEQERYEEVRPLVLFDASVAERAREVGTSASTLYRRLDRFAGEGMDSLLFDAPTARRKLLPPAVRRLILDLFGLAENLGEDGWLKALRLEDYAARRTRHSLALQQALFSYGEAWG